MDRDRSKLDIFGKLQKRLADLETQLTTQRNQNLALPDWIWIGDTGAPAFQNSWTNLDAVGGRNVSFWRDSSGIIHLAGYIAGGGAGTTMFTLPPGFRCGFQKNGGVSNQYITVVANSAFGMIIINSDGTVQHGGGSTTWMSLYSVTFRAEN